MTMLWSEWEWELEEEYRPRPKDLKTLTVAPKLAANGVAEIKPHNLNGIRDGIRQLAGRTNTGPKILITYLPVDNNNNPVDPKFAGVPAKVRMFLTDVTGVKLVAGRKPGTLEPSISAPQVEKKTWYFLGQFKPPAQIDVNLANKAVFGAAMEQPIRKYFNERLLQPPRKMKPGGGGNRPGPDIMWDELAEFYRELGRLGGDPFYAELASELATLR